jgi:uncharacterized protein YciI
MIDVRPQHRAAMRWIINWLSVIVSIKLVSSSAKERVMYYMIYSEDIADSLALRLEHRPAHLARLQHLTESGRLLLAGPTPAVDSNDPGAAGFSGSLVVAEFASLTAAQEWAAADPFILNGVYARSTVKPFKKVLP